MAAHRSGHGPHLVLSHGGMGSWKHWIRNVEPLAARFTVLALDHPSYGASAAVPRETTGPQYLDLVHELILEMLPGDAPLRFAGFSFGMNDLRGRDKASPRSLGSNGKSERDDDWYGLEPPNIAVEQTAGSRSLAAAAHCQR